VGRNGADIESAQVAFAAHVEARVRRRDVGSEAGDKASLQAHAESVLRGFGQGYELREGNQRAHEVHDSAQPGYLAGQEETVPGVGPDRVVDAVESERWRERTGNDALQRIRTRYVAEAQGLEQVAGSVAEGIDRGVVEIVRQPKMPGAA